MHNNFGVALFSLRQVDQAIEQFSQAIQLRPEHLSAHYNLAIAFEARNQFTEAAREYSEVLKLDPNCAPAQARLGVVRNKMQTEQPQRP
jgi:tetratricopeptide (TPR) repeat protein